MPTKERRREQIAAFRKQERQEIRDDGPAIRRMLEALGGEFDRAAGILGVDRLVIVRATRGYYTKLPLDANDGMALGPKDRLDLFFEVGDPTKLPQAQP